MRANEAVARSFGQARTSLPANALVLSSRDLKNLKFIQPIAKLYAYRIAYRIA